MMKLINNEMPETLRPVIIINLVSSVLKTALDISLNLKKYLFIKFIITVR